MRGNRGADRDAEGEKALWWGADPRMPRFLQRMEAMSERYGRNDQPLRGSYTSLGFAPGCIMHGGAQDEVRHILERSTGKRTSVGFLPHAHHPGGHPFAPGPRTLVIGRST